MQCEEDAEPVSTPSSRRSPRFFQKNSPRALRALRFDRLSDLCRLAASRPQNAVRGGRRAGFNAELAEIAEILPEEFSARSACSAFLIVSATSAALAASRPQNAVRGGRRAGFNAELAEIAETLPEEFSARSAF